MASQPDDLEAIRTIVGTLTVFDPADQERIIRWAREKLQLPVSESPATPTKSESAAGVSAASQPAISCAEVAAEFAPDPLSGRDY